MLSLGTNSRWGCGDPVAAALNGVQMGNPMARDIWGFYVVVLSLSKNHKKKAILEKGWRTLVVLSGLFCREPGAVHPFLRKLLGWFGSRGKHDIFRGAEPSQPAVKILLNKKKEGLSLASPSPG